LLILTGKEQDRQTGGDKDFHNPANFVQNSEKKLI
jgi:hypothetical protein